MTEQQAEKMIELLESIESNTQESLVVLHSILSNTNNISFSTNDLDNVVSAIEDVKSAIES